MDCQDGLGPRAESRSRGIEQARGTSLRPASCSLFPLRFAFLALDPRRRLQTKDQWPAKARRGEGFFTAEMPRGDHESTRSGLAAFQHGFITLR